MKLLFKLVPLGLLMCFNASAVAPVKGSVSPWGPPERDIDLGSEQQQAQLRTDMQPCIERAKKSVPGALQRFKAREFRGAKFFAIIPSDNTLIAYIDVKKIKKGKVYGRVDTRNVKAGRQYYLLGNKVQIPSEDIVDWYVLYEDRPPEGNLLGRYLLQRMDGLVSGACNPDHSEFQQYRVFTRDYSFVPPGSKRWEMPVSSREYDAILGEKGENPDERNTLSGSSYRLRSGVTDSDLVDFAMGFGRYGDEEGVRYNVVELEAAIYDKPGVRCARSQHVVHDKEALLSTTGNRGLMIRDVETLICVHPADPEKATVLTFSHRHHPGKRDPEFSDKANRVFESMAFKDSLYRESE